MSASCVERDQVAVITLDRLQRLRNLNPLILFGNCNCNCTSLAPLRGLSRAKRLRLEGGFSMRLKMDMPETLGRLTGLEQLRVASMRAADKSLRPLRSLASRREVFICRGFPAAEYRAFAVALPLASGECLDAYRDAR